MNWVQSSDNQGPINLDNIITFEKEAYREQDGPFEIIFFSVSGKLFYWRYCTESDRDEDYQLLIKRLEWPS